MASVANTIEFIRSHGFFATETADGILALMPCGWVAEPVTAESAPAVADDDRWHDEPAIFPVVAGNVSTRAVREWLGY